MLASVVFCILARDGLFPLCSLACCLCLLDFSLVVLLIYVFRAIFFLIVSNVIEMNSVIAFLMFGILSWLFIHQSTSFQMVSVIIPFITTVEMSSSISSISVIQSFSMWVKVLFLFRLTRSFFSFSGCLSILIVYFVRLALLKVPVQLEAVGLSHFFLWLW